jgi:hypothetical protein
MKALTLTAALLLSGNLYAGIYGGFGDVGNSAGRRLAGR